MAGQHSGPLPNLVLCGGVRRRLLGSGTQSPPELTRAAVGGLTPWATRGLYHDWILTGGLALGALSPLKVGSPPASSETWHL